MQLRADQLPAALARGLQPLYVIHGDEPLLAQEAADTIRAAARATGCSERTVHTVAGAHFDWSGLLGDAGALSLFAERRLIEIRIPSGKPGKDGGEALQRYVATIVGAGGEDITLVLLPRLDRAQLGSAWFTALDGAGASVRVDPVERRALPHRHVDVGVRPPCQLAAAPPRWPAPVQLLPRSRHQEGHLPEVR